MTDLSTANLKRLLDQAAPGPWGARGNYKEGDPRPDTSCQIFSADEKYLGIVHRPHVDLAAAAPALAQEVLRLRKGLKAISSDLHESALCNGGTDVPYLQGITEQAVETGGQIAHLLGDQDD